MEVIQKVDGVARLIGVVPSTVKNIILFANKRDTGLNEVTKGIFFFPA